MTDRVPPSDRMALTVEEAAIQIGISRALAYRWVSEGVLPAFRVGKVVRIPRRSLEEWLASQPDRRPA